MGYRQTNYVGETEDSGEAVGRAAFRYCGRVTKNTNTAWPIADTWSGCSTGATTSPTAIPAWRSSPSRGGSAAPLSALGRRSRAEIGCRVSGGCRSGPSRPLVLTAGSRVVQRDPRGAGCEPQHTAQQRQLGAEHQGADSAPALMRQRGQRDVIEQRHADQHGPPDTARAALRRPTRGTGRRSPRPMSRGDAGSHRPAVTGLREMAVVMVPPPGWL